MSQQIVVKNVVSEVIGSEVAVQYLSKIPVNRRVSQTRVAQMARAMMVGDWREDEGSPIRFLDD